MAMWSSLARAWVATTDYTHGLEDRVTLAFVPAKTWTPLPTSKRVPHPHLVALHADESTDSARLRKSGPVIEVYNDTALTNVYAELTG